MSGALHGAAAWGAYAVVEFFFSSIVFGIARPYAVFTQWHWSLTALLIGGFLVAGLISGAIAAVLFSRTGRESSLKHAATATLTLAFAANLVFGYSDVEGYTRLLVVALPLLALQIAAASSETWHKRAGLLNNPWIVSGLLLGFGGSLRIRDLGVAAQFGSSLSMWSWIMTAVLVALAFAAMFLGRRFVDSFAPMRLSVISVGAAVLLLAVSGVLAIPSSATAEAAGPAGSSTRPNVLLIVMDTVRADHLSLYGYNRDTTPNLRALARDSVVYPNTLAPSDVTLTSHASLFTGMYPSWHGAYCDPPNATYGGTLSAKTPTLAEITKANGYSTLAVVANMFLRSDFGLGRGFDEFHLPRPVALLPADTPYLLRRAVRRGLAVGFDTGQFDRLFSLGEEIDAHLFPALAKNGQKPFFVFMNYMDAHFPYVPPAPFHNVFPGQKAGYTQQDLEIDQGHIIGGQTASLVYLQHCLSKYDGGIAYVDAQIGKVVEWLKRHQAYDNTMIVVASDHGEAFGERSYIGHGNSPYNNVLHVALMIKYPGNAHPGVESQPVSLIDVAPTVLNTLGLKAPTALQGRDLTRSEALAGRTLYSETFPCPVMRPRECRDGCTSHVILQWPYKYIERSNGKRELFDLAHDPLEEHTLYSREREVTAKIRGDLEAWMKTLPAHSSQKQSVGGDDLRRLKGLGYTQ
ncbi:MAG TPA: sulfatase [Candidatus Solibacter sp.]|nr:sulfatase [Candidatus Solibacter sp.]